MRFYIYSFIGLLLKLHFLPYFLLPLPLLPVCFLFVGVFRFQHPFGMFSLSNGRGNTHLMVRGNMCENTETEYGVFHSSSYYFCVHTEVRNKWSPRRSTQTTHPAGPANPADPAVPADPADPAVAELSPQWRK